MLEIGEEQGGIAERSNFITFDNFDHSHNSSHNKGMKKVSKSILKAKMFEYFRALEDSGEALIVTDFGKPVLKIVPYHEGKSIEELFSDLRPKAKFTRQAVLASTEDEWSEK